MVSVLLMGPAGCGKTRVGGELADHLGAVFLDADDYHPEANLAKMRRGEALIEADRWPWLAAVAEAVGDAEERAEAVVLACAALKRTYRRALGFPGERRFVVELRVAREALAQRLSQRSDHFFDAGLLDSQLAILEPAEEGFVVAADAPTETVIQRILLVLGWTG